jgi:lactoylglutathione lyase
MRVNYAIVFVSDMGRAVAFYRDTLGLPLRFESPHWTEFATDGATLALHHTGGASPRAGGPGEPGAGSCRPGLQVADLDEFHRRMVAHGVSCVQEPKAAFGARVAQYADPDGLVLSVGEERKT